MYSGYQYYKYVNNTVAFLGALTGPSSFVSTISDIVCDFLDKGFSFFENGGEVSCRFAPEPDYSVNITHKLKIEYSCKAKINKINIDYNIKEVNNENISI